MAFSLPQVRSPEYRRRQFHLAAKFWHYPLLALDRADYPLCDSSVGKSGKYTTTPPLSANYTNPRIAGNTLCAGTSIRLYMKSAAPAKYVMNGSGAYL